jgi:hypothetical protein
MLLASRALLLHIHVLLHAPACSECAASLSQHVEGHAHEPALHLNSCTMATTPLKKLLAVFLCYTASGDLIWRRHEGKSVVAELNLWKPARQIILALEKMF